MIKPSLLALVLAIVSSYAQAAIVTFTDPTAFTAAIAGRTTQTVDFDSSAAGTIIAAATEFEGITFDYTWFSGETLRINDDNDTNSGSNYLGASNATDGEDRIADDNNITLTPTAGASALGLFAITQDEAFDGDLRLISGTSQVDLEGPSLATLGDGSHLYFLGLVAYETETLAPVTFEADALAFLLNYRVDGITFAEVNAPVPEPSGMFWGLAIACGARLRRRSRC